MPVRMIAIDIDGTLLDSHWNVPAENRAAVEEAAARGIEIVLVTGRRFDFAAPVARELPCDLHLIVNNGALIKSKDGVTHLRHLLQKEIARRVLSATKEFRADASVVFDRLRERQIIFESFELLNPFRRLYFEKVREFSAEVSPLEDCLVEDPIQVMFAGPFERMRAVTKLLQALNCAHDFELSITAYEAKDLTILDVVRGGCTKGAALAEWAARRGIARQEVMAVGDNWNDREMLSFAGRAVVMGNSVPELKSLGWPVTHSNDDAGLAHAIRTYALREA